MSMIFLVYGIVSLCNCICLSCSPALYDVFDTPMARDVTRLGLGGPSPPPPRTSQPPQTGTVIGLFFALLFWTSCYRLIEDYLFVVFCVVDMIVISLSTTCNQ